MNTLSRQRRQIVILSSIVPVLTLPAILFMPQLHGGLLTTFVVGYALLMSALLAYVISQLVKLKRNGRSRR